MVRLTAIGRLARGQVESCFVILAHLNRPPLHGMPRSHL